MWFAFPEGTDCISVENQEFRPEIKDDAGIQYFRAPDHFAPRILDINGFTNKLPPKEANPPKDLPNRDELDARGQSITQMSGLLETARMERDETRAQLAEVSAERDDLKLKLHEAEANSGDPERVEQLEKELQEFKDALAEERATNAAPAPKK